jgi:HK97 family phage major capsid protein
MPKNNVDRVLELQKRINTFLQELDTMKSAAATEGRDQTVEERKRALDIITILGGLNDELDNEKKENDLRDRLSQVAREPVKPELTRDSKQEEYPGLPPRELRFNSFGEQLQAIVRASQPGGQNDRRLTRQPTGMGEGNPSDGGFLVQTDFSTELLRNVYKMSPLVAAVRKIQIGANSNSLKINAFNESSRVSSILGGVIMYWLGEGYDKTPTHPELRQMELSLKKVAGLMYCTDELLEDAAALESIAREAFTEALDVELERVIVRGVGGGQPLGILGSPAIIALTRNGAGNTIDDNDIINMWSRLYSRSQTTAVWLISQSVLPQLMVMTIGDLPVWLPPNGLAGTPNGSMMGRPIYAIENCSALGTSGDIILADPQCYLLITKGGPQFATSIHVKFVSDQTTLRLVLRVDGQPSWSTTLTPKDNSGAVSPFVVLSDAR